jgi:hypothetical protein
MSPYVFTFVTQKCPRLDQLCRGCHSIKPQRKKFVEILTKQCQERRFFFYPHLSGSVLAHITASAGQATAAVPRGRVTHMPRRRVADKLLDFFFFLGSARALSGHPPRGNKDSWQASELETRVDLSSTLTYTYIC